MPPFASRRFEDLADMCDGLLVDSGDFRGDGRRGLAGMAAVVETGAERGHYFVLRCHAWWSQSVVLMRACGSERRPMRLV